MKHNSKIFISAAAGTAMLFAGGCCAVCSCHKQENKVSAIQKENVELLLPETIYAVPGVETNIYFDNIVRVINPDNYIFEARSKVGRWDEKRWSFTPQIQDVGTHELEINVIGNNGLIASKKISVVVAPQNAGKGKSLSIMIVGDSLTASTAYPRQINDLFKTPGNPKIKMVGTHSGAGRPRAADGVIHEGYGGWTWRSFSTKWASDEKYAKLTNQKDIIYARSPFLTKKDGKLMFDFQGYFDRKNGGKAPDIITFQLGTNDVFSANDSTLEKRIEDILKNMDIVLAETRKAAPNAIIGVGLTTAGAATQDAFGKSYKSKHSRWQFKKNQHRLVEEMMKKFAKSNPYNVRIIPTYLNLDCENNFPIINSPINAGNKRTLPRLNNGVHPSRDGYKQIGDTFYSWMKAMLAEQDKAAAKK